MCGLLIKSPYFQWHPKEIIEQKITNYANKMFARILVLVCPLLHAIKVLQFFGTWIIQSCLYFATSHSCLHVVGLTKFNIQELWLNFFVCLFVFNQTGARETCCYVPKYHLKKENSFRMLWTIYDRLISTMSPDTKLKSSALGTD